MKRCLVILPTLYFLKLYGTEKSQLFKLVLGRVLPPFALQSIYPTRLDYSCILNILWFEIQDGTGVSVLYILSLCKHHLFVRGMMLTEISKYHQFQNWSTTNVQLQSFPKPDSIQTLLVSQG